MIDDRMCLHAFVDGELGLARQLEFEARLREDAALRAELQTLQADREAVRAAADYHRAPAALRARIAAGAVDRPGAVQGASPAAAGSSSSAAPAAIAAPRTVRRRGWFATAALAAAMLRVVALGLVVMARHDDSDRRVAHEAVASHVRATLGQRLVDIASSDQHTVRPWLSARLDFSPPVREVPGAVFLGGRVDHLDGHPVAVLVYRQRQHVIDAFVWPGDTATDRPALYEERGFNAIGGAIAGMTLWVVSDLNRDELAAFAQSLESGSTR